MNKTVLLGAVGAAVTVAALAINYAVTWQDAAVEPVAIEPGNTAPAADAAPQPSSPARVAAETEPSAAETATATASLEAGTAPTPPAPAGTGAAPVMPEFDIVRINPSGDAVIGGRAAAGSLVTLYRDGRAVESITADDRGEWVMLPGVGILNGAREISLSAQLPGQPELFSEQVVVLVAPDPSTGGSQTPLAMLMPRGQAGAQVPAPTGAAAPAPVESAAATSAAATSPAPVAEPPAEAAVDVASADTGETPPASTEIETVSPKVEPQPTDAAAATDSEVPPESADATAGAASATAPVTTEAAAAESAAAAVLELPSLAELQEIGATGGASDAADLPESPPQEPVAEAPVAEEPEPEEAVGGVVAEGRAAEALADVSAPPVVEAPLPVFEPAPAVVAAAPVVETPPPAEEAPQRTAGAGVDSASSQPLAVAVATELPPTRVAVEDNSQRPTIVPPAGDVPEGARNVPDVVTETVAALDIAVSRDAGPGGDFAAAVSEDAAADAVRPEVTENITVTEIMIELKWSHPVVLANQPASEIVADAPLTVAPENPSTFRIAALPVRSDMPSGPLWTPPVLSQMPSGPLWTPPVPEPAAQPSGGIGVTLASLPVAPDMAALDPAMLPMLEVPTAALPAATERWLALPADGRLAVATQPATVRFAALSPVVLPGTFAARDPALEVLPSRTPDAGMSAPGDLGGRDPLAPAVPDPVIAEPAELDLLDTASYQSTNPATTQSTDPAATAAADPLGGASYQSTTPAVDAGDATAASPLDSASYQSTSPTTGGLGTAGSGTVTPADSVDALLAEAKSALDAATRAQEALDGVVAAATPLVVPAALPSGALPKDELPALAAVEDRPSDAADSTGSARPLAIGATTTPPVDWSAPAPSVEITVAALPTPVDAAETAASEGEAAGDPAAAEPATTAPDPGGLVMTGGGAAADVVDVEPAEAVAGAAQADAAPVEPVEIEIALATPETATVELLIEEPSLDLGSFQRDDRLADGAYDGLDSQTLQGEGIRSGTVALQSVEYDERGEVVIGGTATPNAPLNIYVDNVHVGSAVASAGGEWKVVPNQPLSEGLHYLRVDQVEEGGKVVARVESPFARVEPIAVTAGGGARVVVQPGNSLWRIARRTLEDGTRYTAIYEANKSQIIDPDMIYPGQVFVVPSASETN